MKFYLSILFCLASITMNPESVRHTYRPSIQQIAKQKEEKVQRMISKLKVDIAELKIKNKIQ
jgi:hypothetical protein